MIFLEIAFNENYLTSHPHLNTTNSSRFIYQWNWRSKPISSNARSAAVLVGPSASTIGYNLMARWLALFPLTNEALAHISGYLLITRARTSVSSREWMDKCVAPSAVTWRAWRIISVFASSRSLWKMSRILVRYFAFRPPCHNNLHSNSLSTLLSYLH